MLALFGYHQSNKDKKFYVVDVNGEEVDGPFGTPSEVIQELRYWNVAAAINLEV